MRHLSLRHKINGAISITILLVAIFFTAIQVQIQRDRFQKDISQIEILLQTLVERDSEQLANEIFDNRKKAIDIRLNQMRMVEGIISISVFDHAGKLLSAIGQTEERHGIGTDQMNAIRRKPQTQIMEWEGYGSLLFSHEISFLGQEMGFIRIHYSLETIETDIRTTYLLFGGFLATTFAMILALLNLILSKTILTPILRLKNETRLIVQGNYENEVRLQQKDEIGKLADSFEKMRLGIKQKVSDLEHTEESLRERDIHLRLITENMVDMIFQTDPQINFEYLSPSIERVFGYSPDDLIGEPAVNYVHPDDIEPILNKAREARLNRKPIITVRYRFKHSNGKFKWVESTTRLLYDDQGQSKGAIFSTRDIDKQVKLEEERKKLERQLTQTQKLEAIGHLAGGVAHDLNNLLSPILGYTEMLLGEEAITTHVKEKLRQIYKAGLGARDLVRQLLAFGRKQTLEYKPLNINETIRGFEKLIRRTVPEDIEIEIIASEKIQPVLADVGQIEQVIMNLSINAADAMKSGGRLTIETDLVELDETYVASRPIVKPGSYVLISFSDTGCGMDEQTQEQIFEPFFSTKGQKGTGLGLATVYGIVKQHNGNIWVYSEPDEGTTIKIYLPVTDTAKAVQDKTKIKPVAFQGVETILLVEDNQQVRTLAQTILELQGYKVLVAVDGVDALEQVESYQDKVHLLLTDVVLPNLNGKEIYEIAFRKHPALKVLYMSGYTENIIAHRGVLDEGINFIQKPFSVQSLGSKVREVLDNYSPDTSTIR
jgi:PAS domain S-box-containing protein